MPNTWWARHSQERCEEEGASSAGGSAFRLKTTTRPRRPQDSGERGHMSTAARIRSCGQPFISGPCGCQFQRVGGEDASFFGESFEREACPRHTVIDESRASCSKSLFVSRASRTDPFVEDFKGFFDGFHIARKSKTDENGNGFRERLHGGFLVCGQHRNYRVRLKQTIQHFVQTNSSVRRKDANSIDLAALCSSRRAAQKAQLGMRSFNKQRNHTVSAPFSSRTRWVVYRIRTGRTPVSDVGSNAGSKEYPS